MKTRTVQFSYGTVKNGSLKVPAEPSSLWTIAHLIRQSWLEYAFRPGCGLMSDEVLVSSIGHSNFMEGALGGWETRLSPENFKAVKELALDDALMALDTVRFRNPELDRKAHLLAAAKNEALSADQREMLTKLADLPLSI